MKVLDLFSGIGGFSLGLEASGFETVAFCEKDIFARKVLKKHWPNVYVFKDITDLVFDVKREYKIIKKAGSNIISDVDLVCGGFPCQPFSHAAHGNNNAYDLWPYMESIIKDIKPKYVIAENVNKGAIEWPEIALREMGYNVNVKCISANDAGADHKRNRWWVIAHPHNESEFQRANNAEASVLSELCENIWSAEAYARAVRVANGVSNRVDRLRCLGNSVLPKIPEMIGRVINRMELI